MKVIITGSTGMVGKGVLLECLESDQVEKILVVNRSPIEIKDEKLEEVLHKDFTDFSSIKSRFKGYDAVFHCMGVSSVGLNKETYTRLTFNISKNLADHIFDVNPQMTFNYVSCQGTDGSENGQIMWANVKGKTENYIIRKGFKDAYAFRPGVIIPEKGVKAKSKWVNAMYIITKPFYPLLRKMSFVTSSSAIGKAMIKSVLHPQNNNVLENQDINTLSKK